MIDEELKLAAFEYLLSRIKEYEKVVEEQGYKNSIKTLNSNKCRKKLEESKMLIKIEIDRLTESVSNPKRDICYGEVVKFLENNSEIKGFRDRVNSLALQVFQESQNIESISISTLDVIPEWLFPTSTANIKADLDKVESFLENELSDIDVDILFTDILMDNKRIQQTLEFWESQPTISKRLPILKEAIEAHIDGKFYLSVATLIPQIEGVLRDSLTAMGRNDEFNSMDRDHMHKAITALIDLWKLQSNKTEKSIIFLNLLPDAVANLYKDYDPHKEYDLPIEGELYRHGVCHGLQTDFGSKKNSTRLILLLDRIIFFYTLAQ